VGYIVGMRVYLQTASLILIAVNSIYFVVSFSEMLDGKQDDPFAYLKILNAFRRNIKAIQERLKEKEKQVYIYIEFDVFFCCLYFFYEKNGSTASCAFKIVFFC
jgi:hypothetical protein